MPKSYYDAYYDALDWKHAWKQVAKRWREIALGKVHPAWKIKAREYREKYFGAVAASKLNDVIEIVTLDDKVSRQRELLEEVEWAGTTPHHIPSCPICWESQDDGHADDCRLKEVLNND